MKYIATTIRLLGISCLAFVLVVSPGQAKEKRIPMQDAPGVDVLEDNCGTCHSLDYIRMNSRFMDAKTWEAEVNKMIKTFGAPISEEDSKIILEYLIKNYGKLP